MRRLRAIQAELKKALMAMLGRTYLPCFEDWKKPLAQVYFVRRRLLWTGWHWL